MSASLHKAKARLSEYMQLVEKGEDIIITVRGKPKARLTAIREPHAPDRKAWDRHLSRLQKGYAKKSDSAVTIVNDLRKERF